MAQNSNKGGKLNRIAGVSLRLDPKLKHAAEMAARHQRRTLSSFIEWATEKALKSYYMNEDSFIDIGDRTYDVFEADKLINIAASYPSLLTYDELLRWKIIEEHGHFWEGTLWDIKKPPFTHSEIHTGVNKKLVREQWENIISLAEGGEDNIPEYTPIPI